MLPLLLLLPCKISVTSAVTIKFTVTFLLLFLPPRTTQVIFNVFSHALELPTHFILCFFYPLETHTNLYLCIFNDLEAHTYFVIFVVYVLETQRCFD